MSNFKSTKFFDGIKHALDTNAPTIATFGSVFGVALTIFFMHKASKQAAKVEEKYEEDIKELEGRKEDEEAPLSEEEFKSEKTRYKMDKYLRLIYIYRWALLSGIGSAGFAILSNYLNGRTIATITGLLALNNEKLKEYAKKGKEMIGEDKFKEIQDNVEKELFGEKLRKGEIKTEKSKKPIITKDDDVPWEDYEKVVIPEYGMQFELPKDLAKNVVEECNKWFAEDKTAYMDFNAFLRKLRIPSAPGWEKIKWDWNNPFKAHVARDINFGDGCMKGIIFDNRPDVENSATR